MNADTMTKTIKDAFETFERLEAICDTAEAIYTEDCENDQKEQTFDAAYKASFEALEVLLRALCALGYDSKVWRRVVMTRRDYIRDLIARTAA